MPPVSNKFGYYIFEEIKFYMYWGRTQNYACLKERNYNKEGMRKLTTTTNFDSLC